MSDRDKAIRYAETQVIEAAREWVRCSMAGEMSRAIPLAQRLKASVLALDEMKARLG